MNFISILEVIIFVIMAVEAVVLSVLGVIAIIHRIRHEDWNYGYYYTCMRYNSNNSCIIRILNFYKYIGG